jgi:hypothetical protein
MDWFSGTDFTGPTAMNRLDNEEIGIIWARHYPKRAENGSSKSLRRETRRRLRPTAFDARLSVPRSAFFMVALYCRTQIDNQATSAGSSVREISSPLLLITTQVHSSLTYANAPKYARPASWFTVAPS